MKRTYVIISAFVIVTILVMAGLLINQGGDDEDIRETPGTEKADWSTFMWMCGDGNLGEINMMLCNLHFLEEVEDSEDVNIIVVLDKEGDGDTRLLEVKKGGSSELDLVDIDPSWNHNELNLGDGAQLTKFLEWGVEAYPADHYNVHLVNHGGGWRGMCWDERSDDHLSLPEIGEVCTSFKEDIGRNMDILSTEGCLVGMVEFAYELKDSVDYFIGGSTYGWGGEADPENDEYHPGNWQYDTCWGELADRPCMGPEEFAMTMGETFMPYGPWRAPPYIPKEGYSDVFGVFNLSNTDPLVEALDSMSVELRSKVTGPGQSVNQGLLINTVIGHPEYQNSDLYTEYFSHQMDWVGVSTYTNYDVYDLAHQLSKTTAGTLRSDHSDEVKEGVEDLIMMYRRTIENGGHPDAHGVSIYIPYRSSVYNPAYEETKFAQDTGWDEFIRSVHWT